MNHAGEITPLVGFVRPHVALITTIAPVHIEISRLARGDRRRQGGDLLGRRAGRRRRPQSRRAAVRAARAQARERAALTRAHVRRERRLRRAADRLSSRTGEGSRVRADIARPRARLHARRAGPAYGAERARRARSSSRRSALSLDGAAAALGRIRARQGARRALRARDAERPVHASSTRATTPIPPRCARRSRCSARRSRGAGGRRIAVIGDMLELGPEGAELHAALAPELDAATRRSAVRRGTADARRFTRPRPPPIRGDWGGSSADTRRTKLVRGVRAGDVVMVKGSNGSRMGPIVAALRRHIFARRMRSIGDLDADLADRFLASSSGSSSTSSAI